jgi:hypothetical protein
VRLIIIALLLELTLGSVASPIFLSATSPTVYHTRLKAFIYRYIVYPRKIGEPFISPPVTNRHIVLNTKGSNRQISVSLGAYGAYSSPFAPVAKDNGMTTIETQGGHSKERASWPLHIHISSLCYILPSLTQVVVDPVVLTLIMISLEPFLTASFPLSQNGMHSINGF